MNSYREDIWNFYFYMVINDHKAVNITSHGCAGFMLHGPRGHHSHFGITDLNIYYDDVTVVDKKSALY